MSERFFELPVVVVLCVLWVMGVALLGLCVSALYWGWLLLQALVGS
jgi:hypothetical protein